MKCECAFVRVCSKGMKSPRQSCQSIPFARVFADRPLAKAECTRKGRHFDDQVVKTVFSCGGGDPNGFACLSDQRTEVDGVFVMGPKTSRLGRCAQPWSWHSPGCPVPPARPDGAVTADSGRVWGPGRWCAAWWSIDSAVRLGGQGGVRSQYDGGSDWTDPCLTRGHVQQ